MVRTFAAAMGVVLAGAAVAAGQGLSPVTRTVTPEATPTGPFVVPGTPVGQSVRPVGQSFAPAAPRAGTPIGFNGPGGMPVTTVPPPGKVVDLTKLAAPLTAPLPPGMGTTERSALQRLYDRWAEMIGIAKPPEDLRTNWTPGLSRRNRARHKLPWVWD